MSRDLHRAQTGLLTQTPKELLRVCSSHREHGHSDDAMCADRIADRIVDVQRKIDRFLWRTEHPETTAE